MNQIQTKPFCASSLNLAHILTMVNPFDFGGHSSKVNVTMGIIDKCVNMKDIKPLCISASKLAEMLIMVRGWTLFILEVKGQGHNGHVWK